VFHLDAPSSQPEPRNAGKFDVRIGSRTKSQAKLRRSRISGGFHEESISVDRCTGPAGRVGVCTDPHGEQRYRPEQH